MAVSPTYSDNEGSKDEFGDIVNESGTKTEKYESEEGEDNETPHHNIVLEDFHALETQVEGQQESINQIESQIEDLEDKTLDVEESLQEIVQKVKHNSSEIEDVDNRLTDPERIENDTSIISAVESQISNTISEETRETAHQVTEDRIIRPVLLLVSIITALGAIAAFISGPIFTGGILLVLTIFTWYLIYVSGK